MRNSNTVAIVVSACVGIIACGSSHTSSQGAGGSPAGAGTSAGASAGTSGSHNGTGGAVGGSGGIGTAGTAGAGATGPKLCPTPGWCELANTKLAAVCPDATKYAAIQANEGCSAVINDWSGGIADEKRNRLIIWGGGHHGYFGNELYALDLGQQKMVRLNDPSDVTGFDFTNCYAPDAYPDGRPSSRHTYDGLAYIAHADKMYSHAGAKAPCGYSNNDTWTLDLATISTAPAGKAPPWTKVTAAGDQTLSNVGQVSDYDSSTKLVIDDDGQNLWSYDYDANKFTNLTSNAIIDYHLTGRVDPKRHLFIVMGAGSVKAFDLGATAKHDIQDWTSQVTGCGALIAAIYPGLAYDPVQDRMVGWVGGNDVYVFDVDKKACTVVTHTGGPGAQNMNGTMGRFRYFPQLGVFAVVNDYQQNGFVLRLTP